MQFEAIHFERGNGIARLVLNRPEKLNAFNVLMHREVAAALDAVEVDESLRVLRGVAAGAVTAFKERRPPQFTGR
jgi:2-(1,2-epoxy-1,2-dihydrophenyl)acetyl-CoA isomerase